MHSSQTSLKVNVLIPNVWISIANLGVNVSDAGSIVVRIKYVRIASQSNSYITTFIYLGLINHLILVLTARIQANY